MAAADRRRSKGRAEGGKAATTRLHDWPSVSLDSPLSSLGGLTLLASPHRPAAVNQVMALEVSIVDEKVEVRSAMLGARSQADVEHVPGETTLREFIAQRSDVPVHHVLRPPGVIWPSKTLSFNTPVKGVAMLTGIAGLTVLIAVASQAWWLLAALGVVAVFLILLGSAFCRPAEVSHSGRPLHESHTLREFGKQARPIAPKPAEPVDEGPDGTERVEAVKQTYGELLADIVYRIENSALFDPAVPLSRQFQLLLMRWDDESPYASRSERAQLARELELAFDAARDNAEQLGLDHLPATARSDARRAVGSLRLADDAQTDGERQAALKAASRVLASLALYYLPSAEDTPALPAPE